MDKPESIAIDQFQVSLDEAQRVYCGGQNITGNVSIKLSDLPIIATCIKLIYKGEARVSVTHRVTGFHRKSNAEEVYLDEEIYLIGDGISQVEINSGVYPFNVILPEKLPCSFEGRYGRVRYSLKAILVINKSLEIPTDTMSFTVTTIFDLNNHPLAPLPISESQTKTFMGHSEPLIMSAFLPVRGYVPGQTIILKINLKNESSVDVKKLRIVCKKVVYYRLLDCVRKHKEIVTEIEQPIQRNCEAYEAEFDVPSVPPSGTICNLIDVEYTLKVETSVDINEWYYRMFHKNLKLRASIIIGTIPLKNYEDPINSNDQTSNTTNGMKYEKSRIYRSSKPDHDNPLDNNDEQVEEFSPMYRVYKFTGSKKKPQSFVDSR